VFAALCTSRGQQVYQEMTPSWVSMNCANSGEFFERRMRCQSISLASIYNLTLANAASSVFIGINCAIYLERSNNIS
jgi:hypothetical protein